MSYLIFIEQNTVAENLIKVPSDQSSDHLDTKSATKPNILPAMGGKSSTMQVLVSSNSNNPAALRSETKSGVAEVGPGPLLKDQVKFKSLGDLHMEKGLPIAPRYNTLYSPFTVYKLNGL